MKFVVLQQTSNSFSLAHLVEADDFRMVRDTATFYRNIPPGRKDFGGFEVAEGTNSGTEVATHTFTNVRWVKPLDQVSRFDLEDTKTDPRSILNSIKLDPKKPPSPEE